METIRSRRKGPGRRSTRVQQEPVQAEGEGRNGAEAAARRWHWAAERPACLCEVSVIEENETDFATPHCNRVQFRTFAKFKGR